MATPVWEIRSEGLGPLHIEIVNRMEGYGLNHRFGFADLAQRVVDALNEQEERLRQRDEADTGEWPPLGDMLRNQQP